MFGVTFQRIPTIMLTRGVNTPTTILKPRHTTTEEGWWRMYHDFTAMPYQAKSTFSVERKREEKGESYLVNTGFIFVRTFFVQNGKCSPFS